MKLNIPIHEGDSIMGYFKFSGEECLDSVTTQIGATSTNVVECTWRRATERHTAAYASCETNGSGGSMSFGGPLQSYNTAPPGQVELAQDLDRLLAVPGWMASLTTLH